MNAYPRLFSPFVVKNMRIPNRIFMPPIGTNLADVNGGVRPEHIQYYAARAEGGAGLITIENVCIDYPLGTNGTTQLRFDNDQYLPGIYSLVEKMHAFGSCVSIQINHAGMGAFPGRLDGLQPVSASAVKTRSGGMTREMTAEEIHQTAEKFGAGALRAKRAGCDMVEIHAGHMYLISQFLSPLTNHRTDEFGGSLENRARFAAMAAKAVREQVGPGFPVCLRVSADELLPGGNTLEDGLKLLEHLVDYVDIINVSAGLPESIEFQIDKMSLEDGWRAYMAKAVREKFNKPVITTGNIRNPEVAERLLLEGFADLIGIGRGLIADPLWPEKARYGRANLINRCISCNIGCADNRIASAKPLRCTINPDIFQSYRPQAPANALRVVVAGGGAAGLEAACTAAEAGCQVRLLEKGGRLGGLASRISKFPAKYRIGWFVEYLEERARTLPNLRITLGAEADEKRIESLNPDIIIDATGSVPLLPPIPGLQDAMSEDDPKVLNIFDLMNGLEKFKRIPSSRIVVIGGGAAGLDVIEFFAESLGPSAGHSLSIIEMLPVIGRDLDTITRTAMLKMLKEHKVAEHTNTKLSSVRRDRLELVQDGKESALAYDYAFICLGMRPLSPYSPEFRDKCREKGIEFVTLGDARSARRIIDATREARSVANLVKSRLNMQTYA